MAIFSEGKTTFPDFGVFLFLLFLPLISTPLNALVIRHNYNKQSSVSRFLYILLASVDLLSGLFLCALALSGLWSDKDPDCWRYIESVFKYNLSNGVCGDHYYMYSKRHHSSILHLSLSIAVWTLHYSPIIITGILAIVRFVQILWPFQHIPQKYVVTGTVLLIFYVPFYIILLIVRSWPLSTTVIILNVEFPESKGPINFLIMVAVIKCINLVGILATIATLAHLIWLYKHPIAGQTRSLVGTIKISLLNLNSTLTMGVYSFVAVCMPLFYKLRFMESESELDAVAARFTGLYLTFNVWPILSSLLNALLYLGLTKEARVIRKKRVAPIVNVQIPLSTQGTNIHSNADQIENR